MDIFKALDKVRTIWTTNCVSERLHYRGKTDVSMIANPQTDISLDCYAIAL
jgi:hypothetical protein